MFWLLGFLGLVVLGTSLFVLADEEAQQTLTGLDYKSVKEHLDQFTSKVWFDDGFLGISLETGYLINKFVQAVFWITKFEFKIFAGIYEILSAANGLGNLSDLIRTVIGEMAQVFGNLKNSLLMPVGIMMATYAVYVYFVRNGSFVKTLLKLLAVFAFSGALFTQTTIQGKSGYVAEILYDTVETVTNELSNKVTGSLSGIHSDQTAVLDEYFLKAIWTPYSHMNGEDKSGKIILKDEELKRLVFYNDGDDDFKIGNKKIGEIVGDNKKTKYYGLVDSWGMKFTYAFISVIESFVMGVVIDGFAIFAFVMRLMFILIVFLSPIAIILSLIPTFENILFNIYKKMLISLGLSGSMSIISVLFLYFYNKLGEILTQAVAGNLILGTILKALVLFILWKKRDWLISILTANRVTSVAQDWVHKLPQLNTQGSVNELEYEGEEGKATRMSWLQKGNWRNWLKNKSRPSTQVPTPTPAPVSDFGAGNPEGGVSPDESIEMVPKPIQRPDFETDQPFREEEVPGLRNKIPPRLEEEDLAPKPVVERPHLPPIPPQSEHEVERVEELLENEQRNPAPRPLSPYQSEPEVLKEEPSPPQVRPPAVEPEEVEERLDKTRKKSESSPPKQEVKRPIEEPREISEPKSIPEVRKPIVRPPSKVEDSPFSEPEIKTDRENLFVPEVKFRNRFRR